MRNFGKTPFVLKVDGHVFSKINYTYVNSHVPLAMYNRLNNSLVPMPESVFFICIITICYQNTNESTQDNSIWRST